MIEFVVREGPMFEAMIMNREITNPLFRFLFENQSPAHVYYRWKIFTILQGDTPYKWRREDFRMFRNGSLWRPPPLNPYTAGMPDELVTKDSGGKKGQLSESQRDALEDMLRELTAERIKIGEAMVWCLNHAEAAEEIVECIAESLSILETPIPKKIARLFLMSDILYNCSAKVPNASFFRKYMEAKFPEVFKDVHDAYEKIEARLKAEQFKQKVLSCFRAWEDWTVYPNDYLINLQNVFLGLLPAKTEKLEEMDVDGMPLEMDDPPVPAVSVAEATNGAEPVEDDGDLDGKVLEDVDGMPLPEDLDGTAIIPSQQQEESPRQQQQEVKAKKAGFRYAPSKWESVDQEELEAQAMTTSKWDLLEPEEQQAQEDLDGRPMEEEEQRPDGDDDSNNSYEMESRYSSGREEMTEERRQKLREIEVKVMKYQDEVEAGKRSRKSSMTMGQQVEQYRRKLLQKEEDKARERERERRREREQERVREWERAREREREREASRRDSSGEEYAEVSYRTPSLRRGRSNSNSPSPYRRVQLSPNSPPAAYRDDSPVVSSKKRSHRSRSRSPKRSHRSKSPKKSQRSRSSSPRRPKRSRSRSLERSPSTRYRHKHKKNKY